MVLEGQSTEWSLRPLVLKQICQKWFTTHVHLFANHLNHKLPQYVSPVPDPNASNIDALNINWMGITAYAYPPTCYCLIIVIVPKSSRNLPKKWNLSVVLNELIKDTDLRHFTLKTAFLLALACKHHHKIHALVAN